MGPTWVRSAPVGPHVGPMNLAIRVIYGDKLQSHEPWKYQSVVYVPSSVTLQYGSQQIWLSTRTVTYLVVISVNSSPPGQNGRHFAGDIFRWIFVYEMFWILIEISLGVQLTISEHRFRYWLGAEQATNHYLNQWRTSLMTHICGTR